MTISSSDMLLFATVVREGGFTRAAKQLGITKQTVSERIAKLEQRLGVRLLERTTRRLRTTDAGATYSQRCSAIAAQIDDANSEVQRTQVEPVGPLRMSAPVLYGRRYLAPVVSEYLQRYPRTSIEIVLADRRVDLIAEGFDLAIRIGKLDDASLAARKLGDAHVYFVAAPSFVAHHGTPTLTKIRSARCVGMRSSETWEIAGTRVKVEPVLVVNDLELACEAALAGIGIARVPAILCQEAVADGRLRVLFGPDPAFVPGVYAVFPSRRHLPAKVRFFLDTLATSFAPMLPLAAAIKRRRSR